MRRPFAVGSALAALLMVGAPAASAAPALDLTNLTASASAAGPSQQTSVTVTATLAQQMYANISYDITLQGFKVTGPFAKQPTCPASAVTVSLPSGASVLQCGLAQVGTNAVLTLAFEGTFRSSTIAVVLNEGHVLTPRPPGEYSVTVSSWAFDPESVTLTFNAQSFRSCAALNAVYPTGVALRVSAQRAAVAAGYRAPIVNPAVFLANRPLPGARTGAVCRVR